ncbi:MAG: hypothetical protein OXC92_08435 [Flavobacteriaceae bacterium]|nr:hypothetical protein [Flavobacteriaceae bacterium]
MALTDKELSQIKYDDVFEKVYIWDYKTDELTLEDKELIIPRLLYFPDEFDENIKCLEKYYTKGTIYDVLEKTRELLFDEVLIQVCRRYGKPLFPRLTDRSHRQRYSL